MPPPKEKHYDPLTKAATEQPVLTLELASRLAPYAAKLPGAYPLRNLSEFANRLHLVPRETLLGEWYTAFLGCTAEERRQITQTINALGRAIMAVTHRDATIGEIRNMQDEALLRISRVGNERWEFARALFGRTGSKPES